MIKWMESKHRGRNGSNHDFQVMISIIKNGTSKEGAEKRAVAVRFYHSKEKEITNTGRLQIGIDEETERIYFASAPGTQGIQTVWVQEKRKSNTVHAGRFITVGVICWGLCSEAGFELQVVLCRYF